LASAREHLAAAQVRAGKAEAECVSERDAHDKTRSALDELRSEHSECEFAFTALKMQIDDLRAQRKASAG